MAALMQSTKQPLVLLSGNSHPELTRLILERMGVKQGEMSVYHQANRETTVEIKESVRGKDVYIVQTGTKDVNNDMMELLIIAYACMSASARRIVGVVPYLPYCGQSRLRKRGCIVSKLLANMLSNSGLSHIITMDIYQKEIQGFFDIPVDNLRASAFLIEYIMTSIPDYRNSVIVARNANSVKRATSFAERLRLSIAVVHGEERVLADEEVDGRQSPPLPEVDQRRMQSGIEMFPVIHAKEKPPLHIVGDVGGKIAIVVDCLIDEVQYYVSVADALKERGAYKIYIMATHGLLTSDAPRLIEDSAIDEVVVTNTVPHDIQKMQCHKIKTVDISIMLSEAIRRIHYGESMSYLFKNIAFDD